MLSLTALRENPYAGKKLQSGYRNYCAIRVWPYRVVYRVYDPARLAIITRIGHR